MKLHPKLLAILILLGHQVASAQEKSLADVIAKAERAVVRIEVKDNSGGGLGSGYIIDSSGIMVTNVHVMAGARSAVAIFPNGKKHRIKGTYLIDVSRDICITQLDGSGFSTLPLATNLPRKGEEVTALGSPQGLSFTATRGIVSAIRGEKEMARDTGRSTIQGTWIQVDAALSPGNSGGPIINRDGQLVAMSTLASLGGRAQNLNFGISVTDVEKAIKEASTKGLRSLKSAIANVKMATGSPNSVLSRNPIPTEAIEKYVVEGKESFKDLAKELRKSYTRANNQLKEMKKGETRSPDGRAMVRRVDPRGNVRYYFRSERIKDREVKRQQDRVKELAQIKGSVGWEATKDSLLELLWHNGPAVDARSKGTVGFLNDAVVLRAANEHDVVILYDDAPYLLWVEDTTGLSTGQILDAVPVYVEGAKTIDVPDRGTVAVTILNSLLRSELKKTIFSDDRIAQVGYRTWKDKSGKFSVKAELVSHSEKTVVLRKEDGTEVKVPLSRLSEKDRDFLKKN